MRAFYYLNYFIYRFYERRDSDPVIYVLNGSALIILLNLMTIFYALSYFLLKWEFQLKYYIIIALFILIGCNYLLLYKNGNYNEIFGEIEKNDNITKQIFCLLYILISCISCISVVLLIKYMKFGSI